MTLPSDTLKYYPVVCSCVFQRASYLRISPPYHPVDMVLLNFTSFTMKMGAADSSKTLIIIYQIIRRRILEYSTTSLVITAKKFKTFRIQHANCSGVLCYCEQCSNENTDSWYELPITSNDSHHVDFVLTIWHYWNNSHNAMSLKYSTLKTRKHAKFGKGDIVKGGKLEYQNIDKRKGWNCSNANTAQSRAFVRFPRVIPGGVGTSIKLRRALDASNSIFNWVTQIDKVHWEFENVNWDNLAHKRGEFWVLKR